MLMALSFASDLFLAGQTSTHNEQPVQSSAATCNENFIPLNSGTRASVDLKVAGAFFKSAASYTLARMVACGQIATHFRHWMQVFSSQTGISSARLRFSNCAVAVGKVPSFGNALTGNSSPK